MATEMAVTARQQGLTVALRDLDTLAEMALPTLPDWEWAHRIHAQVVGAWLATDIDIVIDEGTSSRHEVDLVLDQSPAGTEIGHLVLTADFEASLARAQGDPKRGVSKERDFLRAEHAHFARELPKLPADLVLHVEGRSARDLALCALQFFGIYPHSGPDDLCVGDARTPQATSKEVDG